VELLQNQLQSVAQVAAIPVMRHGNSKPLPDDIAILDSGTIPGELDRYSGQHVISLTANVHDIALGEAVPRIQRALNDLPAPPRGVTVSLQGEAPALEQTLRGLRTGHVLAVAVIFLLLTAYFQSARLALTVVLTIPAVLDDAVAMLLLTSTILNIQSFLGAIIAIGIAVANSILLVTFAALTLSCRSSTRSYRDALQRTLLRLTSETLRAGTTMRNKLLLLMCIYARTASAQNPALISVISRPASGTIDLPAEIAPYLAVTIDARMFVDRGSVVKQGQLLVTLTVPEMQARIAQAQAQLAAQQSTYDRLKQAADAENSLVAYLKITAPFDAAITDRLVHPGARSSASPEGDLVAVIGALSEGDKVLRRATDETRDGSPYPAAGR
jgi:hypothetical protein